MKIAIIDLGTNTFKLKINEVSQDGSISQIFKAIVPVKLGAFIAGTNQIPADAFARGIAAMKQFHQQIEQYQDVEVFAFGTAAMRNSTNGQQFADEVLSQTGIQVQIISGDQEAELIYKGVRNAVDIGINKALIIDIGGGSTEFIIADKENIWWKKSFNIGSLQLPQKTHVSNPIKEEELLRLKEYINEQLKPLWQACTLHPVKLLIGASGSFDSIAEMISYRSNKKGISGNKTEYLFNLAEFDDLYKMLIAATTEERLNMQGLPSYRADVIVIAVILIEVVLKQLHLSAMKLSSYSMKEGILFNYLQQ